MPFAGVCGFTDAIAGLGATGLEVIVPRIVPRQRLKPRLSGPRVQLRNALLRIGQPPADQPFQELGPG